MNVNEKAYFYALDAIGQIAYSQSFDCLKLDKDKHGMLVLEDQQPRIHGDYTDEGLRQWVILGCFRASRSDFLKIVL
jgi:hypothetical protein